MLKALAGAVVGIGALVVGGRWITRDSKYAPADTERPFTTEGGWCRYITESPTSS